MLTQCLDRKGDAVQHTSTWNILFMHTIQGIQGEKGVILNLQMKEQSLRGNRFKSKACVSLHSRGLVFL